MTEVAAKIPLRERVNFRLIFMIAALTVPLCWAVIVFLEPDVKDAGGGYKEVNLKAISTFAFDQNYGRLEDVPQRWRELNGQKVILIGEMWITDSLAPEVENFELCYSIAQCCFTGPPQVQHFVKSKSRNGPVPRYPGLVKVSGTLHVNVVASGGKVDSVYQLDVDSVEKVN